MGARTIAILRVLLGGGGGGGPEVGAYTYGRKFQHKGIT